MSIEFENQSLGKYGRVRLDAGNQTVTGDFVAVKAVSTDFTYDTGCVADEGDAPEADDPVVQGDVDIWPASTVVRKTGIAYAYYERNQG